MHGLLTALLLLVLALAAPARAQDQATLVADRVAIVGESTLVAEGGVEVFYRGRRLRASRIAYDAAADRLVIDGPITLDDGTGAIILADQADLAADLTEGVLRSARLVLNQQLQLAASEIMRVGGRYTALGRTVASSCRVCAHGGAPLWEIRARRVVHDQQERQIYFDSAQLRLAGVPVFWIPRLRMPDPTLKRAAGFLMPSFRNTTALGAGIRVPYFIPLGASRDVTVTPYVATKGARSIDLRYRQAFLNGRVEVQGALSRDELRPDDTRGYARITGQFDMPRDFDLSFRLEAVTDPAYLIDYGISDKDRIDSRVTLERYRRSEAMSARLINYNSIRDGEANATLPSVIGDVTWERRFAPAVIGGQAGVMVQTRGYLRSSSEPLDLDGDGIGDGRDTLRLSLAADWRRDWVLPAGVLAAARLDARADTWRFAQDAALPRSVSRATGTAAVELRWPWVRAGAGGARQVIEPVAMLLWSPRAGADVPNEDGLLPELDEGNLFSTDRFPGADLAERGLRANLGVSWTRHDADGWSAGVTVGRILRDRPDLRFSQASGLGGSASDWLAALRLETAGGLALTNRLILDDDGSLTKAELRLDLDGERLDLGASAIWMQADPAEARDADVRELDIDGGYAFTPALTGRLSARYDFEADRAARAGLRIEYRNECLKLDLSLSRRFTSSTSVQPVTDFGLSVELLGFGGQSRPGPSRLCRG